MGLVIDKAKGYISACTFSTRLPDWELGFALGLLSDGTVVAQASSLQAVLFFLVGRRWCRPVAPCTWACALQMRERVPGFQSMYIIGRILENKRHMEGRETRGGVNHHNATPDDPWAERNSRNSPR